MNNNLRQLVIDEFSGQNAQEQYIKAAEKGLWDSEKYFIEKYFINHQGHVLDLGCGTGRTTFPLGKIGYNVVGVDLAPAMIENAKKVALKLGESVDFRVGDALNLEFLDNSFDYVLFSNQGLTQIPDSKNRLTALNQIYRVLKPNGILIFTAHQRVWWSENLLFWLKQWLRFYILKRIGFRLDELDFGDRFFDHDSITNAIYNTKQYIHIPSINEVKRQIGQTNLKILEINNKLQISQNDVRRFPPTFFICQK